MPRAVDLTGISFGKLVAIAPTGGTKLGSRLWKCRCECGTEVSVTARDLRSGNTRSCGCRRLESLAERLSSHGMSGTRIYNIWAGMKSRCCNPRDTQFTNYGGRGISIDRDWEAFEGFFRDMGSSYTDSATLERKDVSRNYSLDNCVWVPKVHQALNKTRYRNNKSGYTGISEIVRNGSTMLVATIQDPVTSRPITRSRTIGKHMREAALKELLDWLEQKRVEFQYSPSHGSDKQIGGN